MSKQPNWKDEDAVYKLVESELLEPDRLAAMEWDWQSDQIPDLTWADLRRDPGDNEREALSAWRRGDRKPLAELVDPYPYGDELGLPPRHKDRLIRRQLTAETWAIIRDSLLGKPPVKRGRPKLTDDERRMNPIHDAADKVPAIVTILQQHYQKQKMKDVKDRAYAFAEKFVGIDNPHSAGSKVRNYLNSGRGDRRHL